MQFLESYVGAAAVFIMGVLAVIFSNNFGSAPHLTATSTPQSASSTVAIVPLPAPQVSVPDLASSTARTVATTTTAAPAKAPEPAKPAKILPKPVPAPSVPVKTESAPAPVTQAPSAPASSGSASLDASSSLLRNALVNILCYAPAGGGLHSISGSGVIIDPKGIILTNAHIGQYFLLADRGVTCSIRTGSPAADAYQASLIYVSPAWIHANATVLTQAAPIGTGEYDFALLAITGSKTALALPNAFPAVSLASVPPAAGTPIVIASYGAQFLTAGEVQSSLYPTIVFGAVKDIFTFSGTTVDALSLGGSAAAQEGSSGGGAADASGQLVGTITTSTVEGNTSARTLGAITASYIRAEYASETGTPLDLLLDEPTALSISNFAPDIPSLESVLTAGLQ